MSQATLSARPYVNSNLFSGHYLDERVQERDEWDCDDGAREAMEELQSLYELEGELVESYGEDALIDNWIDEVVDVLGFGTQEEVTLPDGGGFVDELLFESPTARREAAKVYLDTEDTTDLFERGVTIVEAKQWDADFNVRFSEQRPYRNASHQTKHYLENTPPNIQWGVLTNGRKWRLYGTNDYETQTYYEVDLPELLQRGDLEAFKYFYVFFRPAAFHESSGTTFHDEVWSESETASQELGENLQDNVFTALRVLGRGFVETNDSLDIDPDDEEALDELKEQSLVFLYRLMFVLYAEARRLIHPEDQAAQDEYDQNFSLDELRLDIHDTIGEVDKGFEDEFSEYSTTMWSRLEDLFRLIDEGEEDLGIPPYNGGLFDHEEHDFLTDHEVSNQYLAEVIYRLSTTQNDEGRYVLADYADLDTRHLGSVYEGLLEHQFRIAPEQYAAVAEDGGQVWKPATEVTVADAVETVSEGGLYVVNDEGERKATGAYYTPDYVVTYIVEETVGPLVEEIREDLIDQGFEPGTQEYLGPFFRRVTDLRILDPAMGSGHFLTKATGYLSEQVMAEVREAEEEFGVAFDEQHIRREIAKECIYGVDLNGMAVELAKLSMWLETLAADRPLAFLDHHFKQGNSLVGSDIEDIEELESDANGDGEQASLAEFGATREGTIERLMDIYSEFLAIENETVEDVREMKRKYAEIEQDELRKRLVAMANVHTAERFDLDVPSGAYERMARALEDDEEWEAVTETDWFRSAQALAEEQDFFHWKLAFPEAFYQDNGTVKNEAGFDAVVGNPPWLRFQKIPDQQRAYQRTVFNSAKSKYDAYCVFIEQAIGLLHQNGKFGYIVQNRFLAADYGEYLKDVIVERSNVRTILDFEDAPIFQGTTTYPLILLLDQNQVESFEYTHLRDASASDVRKTLAGQTENSARISTDELDPKRTWVFPNQNEKRVIDSLREDSINASELIEISKSVSTGLKEAFLFETDSPSELAVETELLKPVVDGGDITRYSPVEIGKYLLFPYTVREDGTLSLVDLDDYPQAKEHLLKFENELRDRRYYNKSIEEAGLAWYEFPHVKKNHHLPKVIFPDISTHPRSTFDSEGKVRTLTTAYGGVIKDTDLDVRYLSALFNSSPLQLVFELLSPQMSGGYYRYQPQYIGELPVYLPNDFESGVDVEQDWEETHSNAIETPEIDLNPYNERQLYEYLCFLADKMREYDTKVRNQNLNPLDYLGTYSEGPALTDIGVYQPPEGVGTTKLTATKEDYGNIRVGTVTIEREDENTVTIHATARYKPDDEDAHETDQWGYTETEPMSAMRLTDLTETEADLVEAFVPVAVEEADGFAGFRETATKTNSLVDRLEAITLPDPDDVADDLERYRETVERAEELDEKIQRTDDLIDEIVYDLYGLTDEEIEVVEEAVADD